MGSEGFDWINYHHLLYFWMVAKEKSIARASEKLRLAQPTVSGQLRKLEQAIGDRLYQRVGNTLVLTDLGQIVFRYADEIFTVGKELYDAVQGHAVGRPVRFVVGVPEVLPKLIAYEILRPALQSEDNIQIVCREGRQDEMLARLSIHELDVVLSDSPASSMARVRAFNHLLGECEIGLFGTGSLVERYRTISQDPVSCGAVPFLLPSENTELRRSFEQWSMQSGIKISISGEFDDTALMKVFAQEGAGLIPAPMAIKHHLKEHYDLHCLMTLPEVKEKFYAITVERKIKHPCVIAISENARNTLFQGYYPERI